MADAEPLSKLEEAVADFWKVVERFPKSFYEKFVSEVKAAAWNIDDDPHCEVPKNIMYMLLDDAKTEMQKTIAGFKVWTPVEFAINQMWVSIGTQDLKLYCNLLKDDDERFPKEFLSGYIAFLDQQKWDSNLDVQYKLAKSLMASYFKKYKAKIKKNNRKKEQKKRAAQAEADQKLLAEEMPFADECNLPVLTEEQFEENRALMRKKFEKQEKEYENTYSKQLAARREELKEYRAGKKYADRFNHLQNEFKNSGLFKPFDNALEEDKNNQ